MTFGYHKKCPKSPLQFSTDVGSTYLSK